MRFRSQRTPALLWAVSELNWYTADWCRQGRARRTGKRLSKRPAHVSHTYQLFLFSCLIEYNSQFVTEIYARTTDGIIILSLVSLLCICEHQRNPIGEKRTHETLVSLAEVETSWNNLRSIGQFKKREREREKQMHANKLTSKNFKFILFTIHTQLAQKRFI